MSDTETIDYLQADFDPWSMTVPRLRSILVKHNVQYPSTAKKPQLVELFNDHIVPQAKKILDRNAKAKRSSMGITDAAAIRHTQELEDIDLPPPPSARRSRSPRKLSARVKTEEPEDFPMSSRKSRSASRQLTQISDEEPVPDTVRSTRRTRRTVTPVAPKMEAEESDDEIPYTSGRGHVFTDDNPFQSGSSPQPVKTPSNRRRTTGGDGLMSVSRSRSRSTSRPTSRRQTDGPAVTEDARSVSQLHGNALHTKPHATRSSEPPSIEAGEEFTPEEQLELMQQLAAEGKELIPRREEQPHRRRLSLSTPLWVLFITLSAAYLAWYRQEKMAVGYCGLGREAKSILPPEVPVPDWAVPFVEPQCEPCPLHAYCYDNFDARCEPDFILKPHPLSLGGLLPLPPTCEPDGEKVRRVKAVADKAIEELRERRAQFECGETDDQGQTIDSPAIDEEELKTIINRKRNKKLNKQEFDDLWSSALGEVKTREEVEVTEKTNPGTLSNTYLASSSLARISFTCAVKRAIFGGLERYRLTVGCLIGLVTLLFYVRARIISNRAVAAQVPGLVDTILDRLSKQAEHGEDGIDDPWLFLPNLRDDVLRSVHSLAEREKIWQRAKKVVEQNSNVRTSQREGRNGEVGRAWEWIGPMSGDGARRRKSGRVSWGPDVKVEGDVREMTEQRGGSAYSRWEEPRPIY